MRPQYKAVLAVLALANLALLGTAAFAAATPQLAPLPALLAPALWPWHPVINGNYEPGREPVPRDAPPRLRIPYDLQPRDVDLIVNFFAEHLR